MDLLQMLKNAQAGKPIESIEICRKCYGNGREYDDMGGKEKRRYICSCPAGDREAKKRAEKNK